MTSKPSKVKVKTQPAVAMEAEVARKIRQHARGSMKAEVCGVLLGSAEQDRTVIEACIAGANAAQGGAHVTFTQDTWEHIYRIKDQQFPDLKIVGWYHSHPGFGVFLSEHDLFIQENFFSGPHQVAWVYDPHTDEEGCFGWVGGKTEKLSSLRFGYLQSVETNGSEANEYDDDRETAVGLRVSVRPKDGRQEPAWMKWTSRTMAYLAVLGLGFVLGHEYLRYKVTPEIRAYEGLLEQLRPELRACEELFQRVMPMPSGSAAGPRAPEGQNALPQTPPQAAPPQQQRPAEKGRDGKH
jgi:proteasome lid subunit RPN8/RPN11